jgi:hypothetical protein
MFEPKIEQCLEERATTLPLKAYRGILPRIELPFVPCCGENEGSMLNLNRYLKMTSFPVLSGFAKAGDRRPSINGGQRSLSQPEYHD